MIRPCRLFHDTNEMEAASQLQGNCSAGSEVKAPSVTQLWTKDAGCVGAVLVISCDLNADPDVCLIITVCHTSAAVVCLHLSSLYSSNRPEPTCDQSQALTCSCDFHRPSHVLDPKPKSLLPVNLRQFSPSGYGALCRSWA